MSDGNGARSLSLPWPAGVTPGSTFFVQFLVQDLSVPDGVTLSNAMAATAP